VCLVYSCPVSEIRDLSRGPMYLQCPLSKARNAGQNFVGRLGPMEGLRFFVVRIEELLDGGFESANRPMSASLRGSSVYDEVFRLVLGIDRRVRPQEGDRPMAQVLSSPVPCGACASSRQGGLISTSSARQRCAG
jgi:hypothetical protein